MKVSVNGLDLIPPSYWKASGSVRSYEMASWVFYEAKFPTPVGFDPVQALKALQAENNLMELLSIDSWDILINMFHAFCNEFDSNAGIWSPRSLFDIEVDSGISYGSYAEACRVLLMEGYSRHKDDSCAYNVKNSRISPEIKEDG